MLYNQYCLWVGRALEYYGEYCEHEMDLFKKLIKATDVVWEIGANTGSQAVGLSQLASQGQYVGFEPQVELFKIAAANLALNGLQNARVLNMALGDIDGVIELPPVNYNMPTNFGGVSMLQSGGSGTLVEIRRIDSLMWLPLPNFVKMDVEGMELMVLSGGSEMLQKMKPIIYTENDRPEKSAQLIEALWALGYKLYWHITPYFNPKNFFGNNTNIFGNVMSFNMLCIHSDQPVIVKGLPEITDKNYHPLSKSKLQL